jgi:hypothetical protein
MANRRFAVSGDDGTSIAGLGRRDREDHRRSRPRAHREGGLGEGIAVVVVITREVGPGIPDLHRLLRTKVRPGGPG